MITASLPTRRAHPLTFVLAGAIVAGTLDIVYACVFWALKSNVPAQRILQSVAAGLLGDASFKGGAGTAAPAALRRHELRGRAAFGSRPRVERSAVDRAERGGPRSADRCSHRTFCPSRAAGGRRRRGGRRLKVTDATLLTSDALY